MAKETKISLETAATDIDIDHEQVKGFSPFHDAARRYDPCGIKSLLDQGIDPNIKDESGRSALHILLQDGFKGHLNESKMLNCLRILIDDFKCDVNLKDKSGECPLSLAVHHKFESAASLLVKGGASTCVRTPRFKSIHSLPTKIALNMPTVMMDILDSGVTLEYQTDGMQSAKPMVKIDWSPVLQYSEDPASLEKYGIRKRKYTQRETSFLYSLLDVRSYETRYQYLSHPLVLAFIHLKGGLLSKKLLLFQLIMTFYPIFYMVFIYFLYFIRCKFNDDEEDSSTPTTSTTPKPKQKCEISLPISIQAYLLALVVAGFALVEVYMQLRVDTKYLRNWRTWVIRITLVIMACTLWPALQFETVYNITWQYPIAALGTFFAWVMFLIQMELLPQVKVYLEMLVSIILSVLKIIILFLPLLIGFYMGFNLMFFEIGNIMTFILMTVDIGSDNYEEVIESAKDSQAWFTFIAYAFTIVFIIVIAIVFMNFLLGVSIDDIQQLKRNAKVMTLSNKVQNFFITDLLFPNRYKAVRGKNNFLTFDPSDLPKFPEYVRTKLILLVKAKYGTKIYNDENEIVPAQGVDKNNLDELNKRIERLENMIEKLLLDKVQEKL